MPFDYKKEYKDVYHPSKKPAFIDTPPINYVAVRGKGDPNEEDGEYKRALHGKVENRLRRFELTKVNSPVFRVSAQLFSIH